MVDGLSEAQAHEEADRLKEEGNNDFRSGLWKEAQWKYSEAIRLYSKDPAYFTNRAACSLKLQYWESAELDCTRALAIAEANNSSRLKALWRRGIARRGLEHYEEARYDLETALRLDPTSAAIKSELELVNNAMDHPKSNTKTQKDTGISQTKAQTKKEVVPVETNTQTKTVLPVKEQARPSPVLDKISPVSPIPSPSSASVWENKKKERAAKGKVTAKVAATKDTKISRREIPVEVVDTLPAEFANLLAAKKESLHTDRAEFLENEATTPMESVQSNPETADMEPVSKVAFKPFIQELDADSKPVETSSIDQYESDEDAIIDAISKQTSTESSESRITTPTESLISDMLSQSSTKTAVESSTGKKNPFDIPPTFPKIVNLPDLTQLLRRPESEQPDVLSYFFYHIPPAQLPFVFGRGGIESEFVEKFLDSVCFAGDQLKGGEVAETNEGFVSRAVDLFWGMAASSRFSVAKVFVDGQRIKNAFDITYGIAFKCGMESNVKQVEEVWKRKS
ncbi:hypothetical protein V1512DRAFT_259348 [Lipomyces arxii]|uniref:uncharacterized protein n=1 Tax=Lipomyces arxii TaxID=56418 RepID=UPI0034CFFB90